MIKITVTIYSTTHCPYCHKAKDFLRENKVEFEDINVEKNSEKAQEMVSKSGQTGVPVIDFNGKIIIGFDRHALEELVKKAV